MVNDTSTLNGSLMELGEKMATNLTAKGVTANASDGLTTLANKILNVPSSGGGCTKLIQGTFTTGSTRASTETVTINYTGNGYPIAVMIYMQSGAYDPDDTEWYNTISQYDVDAFYMTKTQMSSTPTFVASASIPANQGVVCSIYKSSTSNATTHSRNGSSSAVFFNSADATTGYNCVRFKNNTKTLSYYIGNKASNRVGLAPNQTYAYIIVYSI